MAELAIILIVAFVAPLLVAAAVAIGRRVGAFLPARRQTPVALPTSRRVAARIESVQRLGLMIAEGPRPDDVHFCQACGRSTATHAKYCRSCGTLLDEPLTAQPARKSASEKGSTR
jgi:hypothetical protein